MFKRKYDKIRLLMIDILFLVMLLLGLSDMPYDFERSFWFNYYYSSSEHDSLAVLSLSLCILLVNRYLQILEDGDGKS